MVWPPVRRRSQIVCLLLAGAVLASAAPDEARAAPLSPDAVTSVEFEEAISEPGGVEPLVVAVQILLDRARISPGIIDGFYGDNVKKALVTYQVRKDLEVTGAIDETTWDSLRAGDEEDLLTSYTVSEKDVDGPFAEKIPDSMREKAKLESLAYTSPLEALAEKFHCSQALLKALNPGAAWKKAGREITVPRVRKNRPSGKLKSIVIDGKRQVLKGFSDGGKMIVFYPATVGSREFPSPSGDLKVTRVAENPTYTYSSKLSYADLKKGESIEVPGGPNNPVGTIWIALNRDGYGIHGTPEPSEISKRSSHGCVRLTNWDAEELVHLVEPGTVVRFTP